MNIHTGRWYALALISLFSLSSFAAHAGALSVGISTLYNFCSEPNCADGASSAAGLIRDSAGNLYGTTADGGANTTVNGGRGGGTAFEISSAGAETVLYSFGSKSTDGYYPLAGLIEDAAGNLYGTTFYGGSSSGGTVFKLKPPAQQGGAWTETVLWSFGSKSADGQNPAAGLIRDAKGNLYGTTVYGGANGNGTVFEISSAGAESVLYSFKQLGLGDGLGPQAGLIQDAAGNLYGTTFQGGATGAGTVFKLTKTGQETVLYNFCPAYNTGSCPDGESPDAGLIEDAAGNLYGTTFTGGASGFGVVFELDPAGTETVLYSFCSEGSANCTDGANPAAGLLQDAAGNLYSTTVGGGGGNQECNLSGVPTCGTVFKLAPPAQQGSTWTETVLYSFCSAGGANCTDGEYPEGGLVEDSAGNLYGTTSLGGANGVNSGGTVFMFATGGAGGTATVTLTSSPNPSYVEESVTFSAVVSGYGATPTGSVTLEEGTTALGTVTLTNGKASLTTAFTESGNALIVASYSGDQNYKAANSKALKQVVKKYTTSAALASSLNPSAYGQAITFTATVSSAGPTPTGKVTFKNGSKSLGSATLSDGVATLTTPAIPVGTSTITAIYGGDAASKTSTSLALTQTVNQATSTTTIASSVNPSKAGQKVKFTATVTSPTTKPTGTVTFMDGSTVLGTGTITVATGTALYNTSTLSSGSHNITAVYEGTANIIGSTSPVLVQSVN